MRAGVGRVALAAAVFTRGLFDVYERYCRGRDAAERAVVRALQRFDGFEALLALIQRQTGRRLDVLLAAPVTHVAVYHGALGRLLALLPEQPAHPVRPSPLPVLASL